MPELPDITVYCEALEARVGGEALQKLRVANPFLLRSVTPPISDAEGKRVEAVRRLGKRIAFQLEGDLFVVLHLMIAGRLHWKEPGAKIPGKVGLAALDFPSGTVVLTEAGTQRRAWLRLVQGEAHLAALDPGGVEVLDADLPAFTSALTTENHTVKRALTDPRLFSGVGNAYSDEILHRAKLSPVKLTQRLTPEETAQLYTACRDTLVDWTARLRQEMNGGFPEHVTAFRPDFAVHGRFGKPCPVCGAPVQRIVYSENEANYCARCQTGGKVLADRRMSRLLK
jgi:formamidopyrimidine-DNA glycosylase